MGAILFVILRLINVINTPGYDWIIFCALLAVEGISITLHITNRKK